MPLSLEILNLEFDTRFVTAHELKQELPTFTFQRLFFSVISIKQRGNRLMIAAVLRVYKILDIFKDCVVVVCLQYFGRQGMFIIAFERVVSRKTKKIAFSFTEINVHFCGLNPNMQRKTNRK